MWCQSKCAVGLNSISQTPPNQKNCTTWGYDWSMFVHLLMKLNACISGCCWSDKCGKL